MNSVASTNCGAGEPVLEPRDEGVRHAAGADQADGAVAALLQDREHAVGVVVVGVVHGEERRRADQLVDAAMHRVGALEIAHGVEAAHLDHGHRVVGVEHHGLRDSRWSPGCR